MGLRQSDRLAQQRFTLTRFTEGGPQTAQLGHQGQDECGIGGRARFGQVGFGVGTRRLDLTRHVQGVDVGEDLDPRFRRDGGVGGQAKNPNRRGQDGGRHQSAPVGWPVGHGGPRLGG